MALHWTMDKLGTIGGAEAPLYNSTGVFIYNGAVNSANIVHSAFVVSGGTVGSAYTWKRMQVLDSGTAISNVFSSGAFLYVSSGGVVEDLQLSAGAAGYVYSGGVVSGGSIYYNSGSIYRGSFHLRPGGRALDINNNGEIYVGSSCLASGIYNSNSLFICGGTAADTVLINAAVRVGHASGTASGGTAYNTVISPISSAIVHVSNTAKAYNTTANDGGQVIVSSGGYASGVSVGRTSDTVARFSYLYVSSGGVAEDVLLKDLKARSYVYADALCSNVVISSGASCGCLASSGTVSSATVFKGGALSVSAQGAVAKDIDVYGAIIAASGGSFTDVVIHSGGVGYLNPTSASASNVTLAENGAMFYIVDSAAHAIDCVTSSYGLVVRSGGSVTNTTVMSPGQLQVSSGVAYNTMMPSGGVISCHSSGAILSGCTIGSGTLYCLGSADNVNCNTNVAVRVLDKAGVSWTGQLTNCNISSGCTVYASGGTATTTICGSGAVLSAMSGAAGNAGVFNDTTLETSALLYINTGGIASTTTAEQGAIMTVYSGGTALDTTLNNACFIVYSGGYASNVTKYADTTSHSILISGGTCRNVNILGGGPGIPGLRMFSGDLSGVSANVYTSTGPYGVISAGTISDVDWTTGYFYIHTNAMLTSATLHGTTVNRIYGGSAYNVLVTDKARCDVYSGIASGVVLSGSSARMIIKKNTTEIGAFVEDLVIHSGGRVDLEPGNTGLTSCTVSSGGILITSAGTVNEATLDGGIFYVRSGGSALNTVISKGTMQLNTPDGYASNTVITGGQITISSDGSAEDTTIGGGTITALCRNAGNMSGATILDKALLYVSSTGVVTDIVASSGTIDMQGGTITGLTGTDITLKESATFPPSTINTFNIAGAACKMTPNRLTLTDGTLDSSAVLNLASGVLDQTTVTNQAYAFVIAGSAAHNQVTLAGQVHYVSNTTASTAVVGGWGQIHISSGAVLYDGYAEADGFIVISGGGSADSPTIANGGNLYVMAGGIATNVTAENGAVIQVADGGSITYK